MGRENRIWARCDQGHRELDMIHKNLPKLELSYEDGLDIGKFGKTENNLCEIVSSDPV